MMERTALEIRRIDETEIDAHEKQIYGRRLIDGDTPFLSFMVFNFFDLTSEQLFSRENTVLFALDKDDIIQAAAVIVEGAELLVSLFTANGGGSGRALFEHIKKMAEKKKKIIWLEPFISAEGFYRKMGMEYYMDQFMYLIPSSFNGDEQIILRQISSHLTK